MRDYVEGLLELSKDEKCQSCILIQEELRRLVRIADDKQLKNRINETLLDHELHYTLSCKPCTPSEKITDFNKS